MSQTLVENVSERPRVAFLEWLQPFYVGGHWVPEMIERAGGVDVFGSARKPTFRVALQDIVEAAPEVMLISPCGYSAEQARNEFRGMSFPDQWNAIPAVRNHRVYALEANSYFSRPGPRLATGVEILAKAFHPALEVSREAESAILACRARDRRGARFCFGVNSRTNLKVEFLLEGHTCNDERLSLLRWPLAP